MPKLKIYILSHSDSIGGGPRAAYRTHSALREAGVDSIMLVNQAVIGDWTVKGPSSTLAKLKAKLYSGLGGIMGRLVKDGNPTTHSLACLPTNRAKDFNGAPIDLIHLHWVNGEMLSINDIGNIRKPVVWTLHDMWAFSGAEHYVADDGAARWRVGYSPKSRPKSESGVDLNTWTWQRKQKAWKHPKPMHIVTPSRWLTECAAQSELMKGWPMHVVPNPLNTEVWKPVDKATARELLHLPAKAPLLMFGAIGGAADPRKGFDLLRAALGFLKQTQIQNSNAALQGLELIIFGQHTPEQADDLGFPVHYMGHVHDDVSLRLLYSAADVMVVPSRQEAFGQTASEALACGTPVAAFNATGLIDVLEHRVSGYLAKPFEAEDLAIGIEWLFSELAKSTQLNIAARKRAVDCFSYPVVAKQYEAIYRQAISDHANAR
jgi:glycosyltransferase involved in cell wall biosynthesis